MHRLAVLLLTVCALTPLGAAADFGDIVDYAAGDDRVVIRTTRGELVITPLNDATFDVHYVERGVRQLPSFARAADAKAAAFTLTDSDDALSIALPGITARVARKGVAIAYFRDGMPLVAEEFGYFAHETVRGFRFALDPGEKILGGGQRVLGMDRRGHRLPLYNKAHYGYETESLQMYYSLPAVLSDDRYILAFDNTASGWLDIGATEQDVLAFEAVAGRTAYIVSTGPTYPDLIEAFTAATGRQPLPPRWAFGNFASRFGYRSEAQARDVVDRYRRAGVPLDVIVLDLYWFGPDIKGHMGRLDWDRNAFPTPEDMIGDFARDGVRTIAITEPFILSSSDRWDDAVDSGVLASNVAGEPRRFDFYFGNTGLVDVFDERARDWFWQPYEMLFEQGVAATWGDLGEPEVHPGDALHRLSDAGLVATADEIHNAYGHRWAQMVYEKQVERFPDMRPLVMMRSGFVGTQRYGMVPWTGDVARSWGGLKPQVELALSMGLFGLAYTHSDLGGFAGGEVFDPALYARWLQYGVFQPVYRPHAQDHIPPEPVFHDPRTLDLARDAIRLRYRLLPYNYTLAWENTTTGMPLMRPLFFEDEHDPALVERTDAYFWGDAFLVAPVTEAGLERLELDLPRGAWFDFADDTRYVGGTPVAIDLQDDRIPVFVRAGSFVPMADVVDSTDDYSSARLLLHYYADSSVPAARGHMYDDDGRSRTSLRDGRYEILGFEAAHTDQALAITLTRAGGDYAGRPSSRELELVVHNWPHPDTTVTIGNEEVPVTPRLPRRAPAASHDAGAGTMTIRLRWGSAPLVVRLDGEAQ